MAFASLKRNCKHTTALCFAIGIFTIATPGLQHSEEKKVKETVTWSFYGSGHDIHLEKIIKKEPIEPIDENETSNKNIETGVIDTDLVVDVDRTFALTIYNISPLIAETIANYGSNLVENGDITKEQKGIFCRSFRYWPLMKFHDLRIGINPKFDYNVACAENKFYSTTGAGGELTFLQILPKTAKDLDNRLQGKDPYYDLEGIKYDADGNVIWISNENAIIMHAYYLRDLKNEAMKRTGNDEDNSSDEEIHLNTYNGYATGSTKMGTKVTHLWNFLNNSDNTKLIQYIESYLDYLNKNYSNDWSRLEQNKETE